MNDTFEGMSEIIMGRMKARDVTLQRLAEVMEARGCPISRAWLARKIKEPRRFDLGELGAICDILGLNLGELVTAKASA